MKKIATLLSLLLGLCPCFCCQVTLSGVVLDAKSGLEVPFANILCTADDVSAQTTIQGRFTMEVSAVPATLNITCIGYTDLVLVVKTASESLKIRLAPNQQVLSEAEVVGSRVSEKQRQAPLTVESMDVIAIKEAPSGSFYEGLGNLKGVDLTTASLGFKIINTRGFNSTSPVRSLQLIDGVDNQSPGLNFSLGNFLGASDLDVKRVEVIAGASSAYYGPGAFNGVVNMETKDPFLFPGFSMSIKKGERSLYERAIRYAHVIENEAGEEKFGFKINYYFLEAQEWQAENYNAIEGNDHSSANPFGYDAVNIYGDEPIAPNNDYSDDPISYAGLATFYRNGYRETDLVNYEVDNRKFGAGFYYKLNPEVTANYNFAYSNGSTIYQGDNRFALRDVQFFQHKVELAKPNKWFLRAYTTNEDAGSTYDIVTTALRLQDHGGSTQDWNVRMGNVWSANFTDQVQALPRYSELFAEAQASDPDPTVQYANFQAMLVDWYEEEYDYFNNLYNQASGLVNAQEDNFIDAFYQPGTARFDSLRADVTSRKFTDGGSLFYDKSALYHMQGEYIINSDIGDFTTGFSGRLYRPDTQGTIFSDTLTHTYGMVDGESVVVDSAYNTITNYQYGLYSGWSHSYIEDQLKANVTVRLDKNQNFDFLVSPAASLVYVPDEKTTWRVSVSSAIRNPTLADQYLHYNVGRALLLGNIEGRFEEGRDSLFTIESFGEYRSSETLAQGLDKLEWYHIEKIRPERVRTIEAGYRGTWWDHTFIDASGYYSVYRDFIGYNIGLQSVFDPANGFPLETIRAYRVAANATDKVTTTGFSVGFSHFFKRYTFSGNYSWNQLVGAQDDPIVPAFNTPEHKFNLGFSGRDMNLWGKIPGFGFGINYKWVQGFVFEGSPQFTGFVPTYDVIDASVHLEVEKLNATFKMGGSNVMGILAWFDGDLNGFAEKRQAAFNNKNLQVYGGPLVGRLLYASILFEIQ